MQSSSSAPRAGSDGSSSTNYGATISYVASTACWSCARAGDPEAAAAKRPSAFRRLGVAAPAALTREVIGTAATAGVLGLLLIGISRPLMLGAFVASVGLLVRPSGMGHLLRSRATTSRTVS